MNKEEYIRTLTEQIRCKMARPEVAREIGDHIEDQTRAFMGEGMSRQEAESAALKDMGNPVDAGVELDKVHRPAMPWGMIALIIALSVLSCIFQYLLNQKSISAGGDGYSMGRQILFTMCGILAMTGVCFADYTRIAARARELMTGLILLLILGRQFFGLTANGADRWIAMPGGQAVNVLLLLMLTVPLYAAVLYGYRGKGWSVIWKGVLWMVPGCWIAVRCSSIWMACVLFLTYLAMLGLAVWRGWYRLPGKAVFAGICTAAVLLPVIMAVLILFYGDDYQKSRLLFYLSPLTGSGPQDMISYSMVYVREILGKSRLVGAGDAMVPDVSFLPELSDFLLVNVARYYGILAAVLLSGLLIFLLLRFLRLSLRQRNQLGMLMGTGCAAVFLIEAVFYFMNNCGVMYLGNYCPFFSYGGSGAIVMYLLLGIMLSICRYQNTAPERRTAGSLFGIRRPVEKMKG